jgi:hypothetical protein
MGGGETVQPPRPAGLLTMCSRPTKEAVLSSLDVWPSMIDVPPPFLENSILSTVNGAARPLQYNLVGFLKSHLT